MTENEKILNQIVRITHMGQTGIDAVMPRASQPALRQSLKVQRHEYQSIGAEAKNLAKSMGLKTTNGSRMIEHMSSMSAKTRLLVGNANSKIAGMMIQGNTRGMIQTLKETHKASHMDSQVAQLSQKLLETQINNIQQMEGFL